ncbi:28008_t:CDS:2 [Gigaspora margarita]|uniref:28008_t:CDS:1 n=1 Tax=Gigaspora margarita TaxID=4874 RepID=A0ABN7UWH8_GIGMA|nr:28008_t:CDS:2 [Gigaspora margarita]
MDKSTFWMLVDKIKFHSVFYSNSYHNQTDIAIQLAVVLYRLGSNASLWTIATLFGKCEQTILNFLDRLIIAIRSLKDEYIVWPQENYRKEVHEEFEKFGFPMVIGAIDGSHIPLMEAPSKINKDIYMSRKHRYGIHLQAIVDHNGHFAYYLLGDSAYPLLPWLMTPFKDPQGPNAQQQKYYNTIHSKTRVVIEQAFGKLKARFPFLKYMRLKDTIKGTDIIDIALILHNFQNLLEVICINM